jgi:hypothetical protein
MVGVRFKFFTALVESLTLRATRVRGATLHILVRRSLLQKGRGQRRLTKLNLEW